MVVRLLGAVEIASGDGWVSAGRPKQSGVLAVLALNPGQVVTVRSLVEAVWGTRPPETAVGGVYSCVSQLRVLLRPAGVSIARVSGGYRLDVTPDDIDVFAARELAARARRADPAEAEELWERAARLWRGPALAGVKGAWADAVRTGLAAEERAVVVSGAEIGLRRGRHRELVESLSRLVGHHPLSEDLGAQLMLALYRCGRGAEALTHYERLRVRLRDELGHEPAEALQRLHRRILRQDVELLRIDNVSEVAVVPAQLPADTAAFAGRRAQLSALRAGFEREPVVVIDGPAGVGKTTLAIRLGRQLASDFPDGQLFCDLHGYTGAVAPVPSATVLERLLRGLGLAATQIPDATDERAALYRSVLASKRVLVLLDNAFDDDQVRPLLPGAGDSRVLVTSRRRLSGLDEAVGLPLDRLTDTEAAELFGRIAGRDGAADEVADIVSECGGLPLAVRIAAARLKTHPQWTHSDLLRRLRNHDRIFRELELGSRSVAAAFAVSYAALAAEARLLFRRLSLGFGSDLCVHGAAALYGAAVGVVEPLLDELVTTNLLTVDGKGRYHLHDLIRQFSHQTGADEDDQPHRVAAQDRLLRLYLYFSKAAMRRYMPGTLAATEDNPKPEGVSVPAFDKVLDVVNWYRGDRVNLLAAVRYAVNTGDDETAARMSLTLWPFAAWHGATHEFAQLADLGMAAAERQPDPLLRADMSNFMALSHTENARYDDAIACFTTAIRLRDGVGESYRSAATFNNIGLVHKRRGYHRTAIDLFQEAIATAAIGGKQFVKATAHGNCCASYRVLGQTDLARRHLEAANAVSVRLGDERLQMFQRCDRAAIEAAEGQYEVALRRRREILGYFRHHDDAFGVATNLNGAAVCLRELGRPAEAFLHHREALDLIDEAYRYSRANVLNDMADTYRALGDQQSAVLTYGQALELAVSIDAREYQAQAHHGLAEALGTGDRERAEYHRRIAVDLCRELGLPRPSALKGF